MAKKKKTHQISRIFMISADVNFPLKTVKIRGKALIHDVLMLER
jgi:hypothetical protein